jgi:hypothetical protein
MGCKTTVLRAQRHGEFLAARRHDPVTRRVFKAGDRVTLCAACLLPFLEESWGGVGGTHCGQTATVGLDTFETAATTPAAGGNGNSGAGDADGRPHAGAPDSATRLRPLPCKLREVPVRLRG